MSYKILEANEMHFKTCTKCGETLPATTEYFHKQKRGKYGLRSKCKKCILEQKKQYYEDNKDKISEYKKQYYEDNKDKIKQYCENNKDKIAEYHKQYREDNKDKISEKNKQYYENNKDKIAERNKQWYEDNKDKISEKNKQYYEDNKDKIIERKKQYYENNKEKISEKNKQYYENNKEKKKQYYENNKEKIIERKKQYYENNKEKIRKHSKQYYENNKEKIREHSKQYRNTPQGQVVHFNSICKRRTQKQNQGNGINKDQWLEMMEYFGWKCAYSGKVLSKDTRSIDHIKSLNQGGEHEVWNCVPMYKTYNISKSDKDLLEWYQQQGFYSEERLQKIYEWQEYAYNKYSKK